MILLFFIFFLVVFIFQEIRFIITYIVRFVIIYIVWIIWNSRNHKIIQFDYAFIWLSGIFKIKVNLEYV